MCAKTAFCLWAMTASLLPSATGKALPASNASPSVLLLKTPNDGIQPQAVVDATGTLHLLYFKGKPEAGDLFYVRRRRGEQQFSAPIRVNSQPGSAIAVGTIRGGQIAVGKGNRVHVAWNGSGEARPHGPKDSSPMLYARMNAAGTTFDPQRNLMHHSTALDGGGTLAADRTGNVYVAWHGLDFTGKDEAHRRVWVTRSTDDGRTFSDETPVNPPETGACGCCGARAFTDRQGRFYLLYRAAQAMIHRDMTLLASNDHAKNFHAVDLHPWKLNYCPMSSESISEGPNGTLGAWETNGQIYFSPLTSQTSRLAKVWSVSGASETRKHPSLAMNSRGDILLAWAEGTGWQKGGDLAWQRFTSNGAPIGSPGRIPGGVPVWGLPAAVAQPDGRFLIVY